MVTNKDIKQYENLVYKIVSSYRKRFTKKSFYIDWDEIEQVGMIALYNSLKHYKPSMDVPFIKYATVGIVRAVLRQLKFDSKQETTTNIDDIRFDLSSDKEDFTDEVITCSILRPKLIKIINSLRATLKAKSILIDRLNGLTLQEIADKYGVTIQNISQTVYNHRPTILKKLQGGNNANGE